jgi:hypothetical protein
MLKFPASLRVHATPVLCEWLNAIEEFHAHVVSVRNRNAASFDLVVPESSSLDTYIGAVLTLLFGIYSAKFSELVGAVITSTVEQNYLVFAYCGRGLIETTATLRFYNRKAIKLAQSAKNLDAFSEAELRDIAILLDKHARGGRFDWARYFEGGRKAMVEHLVAIQKKHEVPNLANPLQVNVKTTIDAWSSTEPAITLLYDYFCELVHPNIGSNFLVVTGCDAVHSAGTLEKDLGRSLAVEGLELLAPVVKEASARMMDLILWKSNYEHMTPRR